MCSELALFDVVVYDVAGNRQVISEGVLRSGAVACAMGYNTRNGSGSVAVVEPAEVKQAEAVTAEPPTCHVVVLRADGTFVIDAEPRTAEDSVKLQAVWASIDQGTDAKSVIIDAEELGDFSHLPTIQGPSIDSDASSGEDDSDIDQGAENATSEEPEGSAFGDLELDVRQLLFSMIDTAQTAAQAGDLRLMASLAVRYPLMRYLQSLMGAVYHGHVETASDIGTLAAGLERFVCQVIDGRPCELFEGHSDDFRDGRVGDTRNDELEPVVNAWLDAFANRDLQPA